MALDNRFRFDELVKQGSRAIISEDSVTKDHTFIDGSSTIISASADTPYEHTKGDRDGEITSYKDTFLSNIIDTYSNHYFLLHFPNQNIE